MQEARNSTADAVVTRVITCQGRDHVVKARSGCRSFVVVNVHFEPA